MKDARWIWIGLGILSLIIRYIFSFNPAWVETIYSRGIFQGIRWIIDKIVWLSPIPMMYVFFIGLIIWLIYKIKNRETPRPSLKKQVINFIFSLAAFVSGLVFFFLFLWGYNYQRIPIEQTLNIQPKALSTQELFDELKITTAELIPLRNAIPNSTDQALDASYLPDNLETDIRASVEQWLSKQSYPTIGNVNGRFLRPKGILLSFSTAGVYFPFVGESNVDGGLHPLTQVHVLAHEFGHGYGFGAEGTCNFIAYLACQESNNPFIKYAGVLGYWRTLAINYKKHEPQKYAEFRANLPKGIIADLEAIFHTHNQYPDFFPKLRNQTYEAYLKAQGIKEGQ